MVYNNKLAILINGARVNSDQNVINYEIINFYKSWPFLWQNYQFYTL